jgi:hypothetical protein
VTLFPLQVLNPSSWEDEKRKEPTFAATPSFAAAPSFATAPVFNSTRLDSSSRHAGGGSLFDNDTSTLANSSGRGSLFDTTRAGSLFDDTSSFFDRSRTGSIFDNEKSLFAANSEQTGVSR